MVRFDIQDHRDGRMEGQKGVVVLAGFHHDHVSVSDAMPGVQQRQRTADHDRGVLVRRHQDVGAHRGGGGFPMGSGDADRIAVIARDGAPGFGAFENGDVHLPRPADFGVFIPHGRRTDDEIDIRRDILGPMPDFNMDSLCLQRADVSAPVRVGTADDDAHTEQNLGQRRHGNTADADQIAFPAGRHIIGKIRHCTTP